MRLGIHRVRCLRQGHGDLQEVLEVRAWHQGVLQPGDKGTIKSHLKNEMALAG